MVNLTSGWNTLWGAISGAIGGPIMTLLTIIGVILVIGSIITWVFQKRRGGSAISGLGPVLWTLLAGAMLAAPQVIIPLFLTILDFIINTIIAIVNAAGV